MVHAMQIRRLCFFAGCVVTGFAALGYRLVDLQVVRHEQFAEEARNNTERTIVRESKRGDIRDIRGNLLATSKIVHTVCANPETLGTNYLAVASVIAPILELPLSEVADKIRPRLRVNDAGRLVPVVRVQLKKKVEGAEWQRVQEAMRLVSFGVNEARLRPTQRAAFDRLRRRGLFDEPEEVRYYPNDSLAAHVLGHVGVRESTNAHGRVDIVNSGVCGMEATLNTVLTGIDGWRQTETDSRQRELTLYREQDVAPRPGLNAVLTLDAGIQHIVEEELAVAAEKHSPVSISCTVVRPATGEIVALANLPTFNPNSPGEASLEARRNRIITDWAEPGSTFKIVVVAAALHEGLVRLTDVIDCENGRFRYGGRFLNDDHPFSQLTVERIINKSSNIGAAKIGILLGPERLERYIRAFGFGQLTRIPLAGEVRGLTHPTSAWSKISITRIPMGHEIACTQLQMVLAMCAMANGGVLMRPMLVDSLVDEQGVRVVKYQPQAVHRVISPEAAASMVTALQSTVSTNGTGLKAKLAYYSAGGKTGTAQKIVDGQYVRNKHYSSFIGFFPADNPELCISVVLDEPKRGYYGSETAAPVFQRIATRAANYLAIPPEQMPLQSAATQPLKLARK